MLKILDTRHIKELDAYTIRSTPIRSIDLMEAACHAFVQWFADHYQTSQKVGIICGTGNNGGDGLGIARLLSDRGFFVRVWIVHGSVKDSSDFLENRRRVPSHVEVIDIQNSAPESFADSSILVDAIFGSGLSRPPEGIYAEVIGSMNRAAAIRVSVDIPSGLFADAHTRGPAVSAHQTVTFQLPKLAFMFPENEKYVGQWHLVDIGLDKTFIRDAATTYFYITKGAVRKILKRRKTFSHKGDYGKTLLVSGSYGKMGACVLAARAALRAGLGLLTVHVPRAGYLVIQTCVPEAMVSVDAHEHLFTQVPATGGFDVIGVGPGIGQEPQTERAFEELLKSRKPMVIDADGLNLLSAQRGRLSLIPPGSVLTPHPGEFERLAGSWKDDFERLHKQVELSKETGAVIVLKGAHTSIASPDGQVYFNSTGNPGMATGGAGDVLTGVITGLRSQKYTATEAAVLGVYLHGLAGDLAAKKTGLDSLIASDIIDFLPGAFMSLSD